VRGLTDKVAIVTGATKAMGAAIAKRLCDEGAFVVGTGRDEAAGRAIAERISADGGSASFVRGDLAVPEDIQQVVAFASERYGPADIVVNNAAAVDMIRGGREGSVLEESLEAFERQVRVGMYAPLLLAQAVLPAMVERRAGAFVSVSAWNATRAVPAVTGYAAAKAALEALDRQIARDYGGYGIRANSVLTGMIRVDQNKDMHDSELGPAIRSHVQILPTVGSPEDIASAVAFLASEDARFITGATLAVEGGAIAKGGFPADLFAQYIEGLKKGDSHEHLLGAAAD
jgi:NAD(P)-dependent dehydrogenase (short-subunit alcohol dehydrogenase family)